MRKLKKRECGFYSTICKKCNSPLIDFSTSKSEMLYFYCKKCNIGWVCDKKEFYNCNDGLWMSD